MRAHEKKEFINKMKAFTKEAAKDFLQKTGIYTRNGNLKKAYK